MTDEYAPIDIVGNLQEEKSFALKLRRESLISPTLIKDRKAPLDFRMEATLYLDRMKRTDTEREIIEHFSNEIEFSRDTRTITTIPAYIKEGNLKQTLATYGQGHFPNHHIVVFLNAGKEMTETGYKTELEKRKSEIAEVQKAFPQLKISVINHLFESKPTLGSVRGLMADAIVTSAMRVNLTDPVLISNDADQLAIGAEYVESILKYYHANPLLDATGCAIFWGGYGPDGKSYIGPIKIPELFFGDLYLQASDQVVRNGEGGTIPNFYTSGPNSTFRLAALCAMGGYDYALDFKEEVEIGRRAKAMRMAEDDSVFFHPEHFKFIDETYVVTSPRRAIRGILAGKSLVEQWDDFPQMFHATEIPTDLLIGAYPIRDDLLQPGDIIMSMRGDPESTRKLHNRIKTVFLLSCRVDRVKTIQHLQAIAHRLGVNIVNQQFDNESNLTELDIDWTKSDIISRLSQWALTP